MMGTNIMREALLMCYNSVISHCCGCRDRASGELLAVKLMQRPIPPMMGTNIMREVKIGAQLGKGHLNIVKPRELILTR
jgi:hypothetical protein